jgi:hypothetical protein
MFSIRVGRISVWHTPVEEVNLEYSCFRNSLCFQLLSYRETAVCVNKISSSGCLIMSAADQ